MAACVSFYFFPFRSYQFEKKRKKKTFALSLSTRLKKKERKSSLFFFILRYTHASSASPHPLLIVAATFTRKWTPKARDAQPTDDVAYTKKETGSHMCTCTCVCVCFLFFLFCFAQNEIFPFFIFLNMENVSEVNRRWSNSHVSIVCQFCKLKINGCHFVSFFFFFFFFFLSEQLKSLERTWTRQHDPPPARLSVAHLMWIFDVVISH